MLRVISIVLVAFALVLPAAWARWRVEEVAREMQSAAGWVCGTPIISIVLLAALVSALMAVGGLATGVVAFRRLPEPRPRARKVELLLLAVPLVCAAGALLWFP